LLDFGYILPQLSLIYHSQVLVLQYLLLINSLDVFWTLIRCLPPNSGKKHTRRQVHAATCTIFPFNVRASLIVLLLRPPLRHSDGNDAGAARLDHAPACHPHQDPHLLCPPLEDHLCRPELVPYAATLPTSTMISHGLITSCLLLPTGTFLCLFSRKTFLCLLP
jgi:hypothetical protein